MDRGLLTVEAYARTCEQFGTRGDPDGYADRPRGRRRRDLGHGDDAPRHDRGQCRPAHHRPRPRRDPGPAAVDHQRLPALPGLPDPVRRMARRPVRAAPGVRVRDHRVRGRLAPVWPRSHPGGADRRADPAGARRRGPHSRQPGHDAGGVPAGRPSQGDRHLVRPRRHRGRRRPLRGWDPGRLRLVAVDLPDQPAPGGDHHLDRRAVGPREPGPRALRTRRHRRSGAGLPRPGRDHLRPHPVERSFRTGGPRGGDPGVGAPSSSPSRGTLRRCCRWGSSPAGRSARPT